MWPCMQAAPPTSGAEMDQHQAPGTQDTCIAGSQPFGQGEALTEHNSEGFRCMEVHPAHVVSELVR